MAYSAFEESIRLLEGAAPSEVARLSRRIRYAALAIDRDGSVAATMFLRRGISGDPCVDVHVLELTTRWRLLGGGGGSVGEWFLTTRPPLKALGAAAVQIGGGGVAGESCWVSWVEVQAAVEVASLQVNERQVPVHDHGLAVVVWRTARLPHMAALGADGSQLGLVHLHDSPVC